MSHLVRNNDSAGEEIQNPPAENKLVLASMVTSQSRDHFPNDVDEDLKRIDALCSPYLGSQSLSPEVRAQILLEDQKNYWRITLHQEKTRTDLVGFLAKTFAVSLASSFVMFSVAIIMPNSNVDADIFTKFVAAVIAPQATLLTFAARYYFKTKTKEK